MDHEHGNSAKPDGDEHSSGTKGRIDPVSHRVLRRRGAAWGLVAGMGLLAVYVLVLALANSLGYALDQFKRLWYWMVPLTVGFTLQVGLFAYLCAAAHEGKARARGVVASGSTSALSMVACCAHHLADVLPIIGLAGVAVVLSTYQSLFLLLGILSNAVGLVYVLGLLRRHGIYPDSPSLLSWSVRWPVDRALPYTLGGSALIFAVAVVLTLT